MWRNCAGGKGTNESHLAGVVVGFALFAAGYSITRKFLVDKNLRLARQNRQDDHAAGEEHH